MTSNVGPHKRAADLATNLRPSLRPNKAEMGEIDLIIVNSGVGNYNPRNIIEIDLQ